MTKLPKLTLKSIHGNHAGWSVFWDAHKTAIHLNSLSKAEKFAYLSTLLEGKAKKAVAGLPITEANYYEVVSILESHFGYKQKIVAACMNILVTLDSMQQHLRWLYDKVEANVKGLDAFGMDPETCRALFTPVLIKKLPAELRLNLARKIPTAE